MEDFLHRFFFFLVMLSLASSFTNVPGFIAAYSAPKSPEVSVQSFSISISPNLSSVNYNVDLEIVNTNQNNSIHYNDFIVCLHLFTHNKDTDITFFNPIQSFNQAARQIVIIPMSFERSIDESNIKGGNLGEGCKCCDVHVGEELYFRVKAMALVCFRNVCESKVLGDADLDIWCDAIAVAREDASGMFPAGPKNCKAGLKWF